MAPESDHIRRARERGREYARQRNGAPEPGNWPVRQPGDDADDVADPKPDREPYEQLGSYRFRVTDSATFAAADYRREFLVRRLLVRDQPAVVGGPKKAMKTSVLVDLAISLGTATPFLGEFAVYKTARVALLSAESGDATLQETARRVCDAKGIDLAAAGVLWGFELPRLSDLGQLVALQDGLRDHAVEAVIIDPLYLALLGGAGPGGPRAENLFDMGPLLLNVTRSCLAVGATPILVAHGTKQTSRAREPLELEDLAYSGIAEFARQWLLISRKEKYEPGTGRHQLWLNVGGSSGHGGLWSVDIDEGVIDEHFAGRKWEVTVSTAHETRRADEDEVQAARQAKQQEQDRRDDAALLLALDRLTDGGQEPVYTKVRYLSGLSGPRMIRAVARLVEDGIVDESEVQTTVGNGAQRRVKALRRRPQNEHPSGEKHPSDGCS